jgi:hypothetical protein
MAEARDHVPPQPQATGNPSPLGARCVVLVGKNVPRPDRLLEGLRKRGAQVELVHDAPAVMVGLAEGAQVVVVNEPRTVRRLPELLAAVRKYYPGAGCWRFEAVGPSGQSQLAAIDTAAASPIPEEPPHPAPRSNGKPPAPAPPAPPAKTNGRRARAKAPPVEEAPPSLISDEELAMLLAPLPTGDENEGAARENDQEEESEGRR